MESATAFSMFYLYALLF